MKSRLIVAGSLALGWFLSAGDRADAQPPRSIPGGRIGLPSSPKVNFPPANPRTRAAPNQVGQASTDFYAKNGYPKGLGDAVEQGSGGGAGGGGAGGGLGGGGLGGGGLGGGGLGGGGLGGGGLGGGGLGGGAGGGFFLPRFGFTGGGFTGSAPKGFGFGGTPDWGWRAWPLRGR